MPGNIISINQVPQYYVGDSKIERLTEFLEKYGFKLDDDTRKKIESKYNPQGESRSRVNLCPQGRRDRKQTL